MTEQTVRALRTTCGAIHYILLRYNQLEIPAREWEHLTSYLKIAADTIYSIEVTAFGFVFTSKTISFRYRHHYFHAQRVIEIKII